LIADYYRQRTGNKVRRVNAVLQHPDEDKAFMLANLDYAVVGSDEVQLLECKSVGEWGTKHWREGVLCMCSFKYSINWLLLVNKQHISVP
jgi:predicted phage-related endonuclease